MKALNKIRGSGLHSSLLPTVTALFDELLFPRRCPVCKDVLPFLPKPDRELASYLLKGGFWPDGARKGSEAASGPRPHTSLSRVPSHEQSSCLSFSQKGYHSFPESSGPLAYSLSSPISHTRHTPPPYLTEDLSLLNSLICPQCLSSIPFITSPVCKKCGRQLSKEHAETGLCPDCEKHIRLFAKNLSLISYDSLMRDIISDIKYRGRREFIKPLALLASARFWEDIAELKLDALIPVPVHKDRLKKRGFNQAELLARELGRLLNIDCRTDILRRGLSTKAQKELGYSKRVLNLQNAFHAKLPSGTLFERVMVVDDIYTTGGTLEACTEALLSCGVKTVYGLCICAGRDS